METLYHFFPRPTAASHQDACPVQYIKYSHKPLTFLGCFIKAQYELLRPGQMHTYRTLVEVSWLSSAQVDCSGISYITYTPLGANICLYLIAPYYGLIMYMFIRLQCLLQNISLIRRSSQQYRGGNWTVPEGWGVTTIDRLLQTLPPSLGEEASMRGT